MKKIIKKVIEAIKKTVKEENFITIAIQQIIASSQQQKTTQYNQMMLF